MQVSRFTLGVADTVAASVMRQETRNEGKGGVHSMIAWIKNMIALTSNRLFILFVSAQTLYNFSAVATAKSDTEYPSPAGMFVRSLAVFNLQVRHGLHSRKVS